MAEIASAFVTIAPSAKGFGSSLNSQVSGPVKASGTSLGKTFGKLFAVGAGVIAAAGIGSLLRGSIDEAREAQKVGAQTAAVLKSTGGVANVSATQVEKLSASLSKKIGVDDEAIQAGQNMLLTFTNVRNEVGEGNNIFARATETVQDMAAAFGGDAVSNSKILGKALNDPIKGVSALTRVGVTFTDKQKAQIKTLVESGKTLKAQKIILGELGKQTKGSAEAQVTASDKASVALGNLKETIGTALLPVVDRLANTFTTKIAPAISKFVQEMQNGTGAGGQFVNTLTTIGGGLKSTASFLNQNRGLVIAFVAALATWKAIQIALAAQQAISLFLLKAQTVGTVQHTVVSGIAAAASKVWAASQWLLNAALTANPIGLVIVGIAALVGGLILAYKKSETFRAVVNAVFGFIGKYVPKIIGAVVDFVKSHWKLLVVLIGGPIAIVALLVAKHFGSIKKAVGAAADFVVNSAKKYVEFQNRVAKIIGAVVNFFKKVPSQIKGFLKGLPEDLKRIGGDIVDGLKRGIEGAWHFVTDKVQELIAKIPKAIRKLMGIASPSKVTTYLGEMIGEGLAKGIDSKAKKVSEATQKILDKLKSQLDSVKSDFASLKDSVSGAFTGNLFEATTGSDFIASLTGTKGQLTALKAAFTKLLGYGLKPEFLSQLFQSGNGGLILDLAAGSQAQAQQANSLFGQVSTLSSQLGTSVADAKFGDKLDEIREEIKKLRKDGKDNARETGTWVGREINHGARGGMRKWAAA